MVELIKNKKEEKLRWGILGTGKIAQSFASDLKLIDSCKIQAVGSRRWERAQAFARSYDIPNYYASYEDLVADSSVDVVYIATPNTRHCEDSLLCLNAGKHVLCEKPFAMNSREVEKMIQVARGKKLFLMEAMWTRFNPNVVEIIQLIESEQIGALKSLESSFGFQFPYDPHHRVFDPALGGGSLLDLGVYNVSLSQFIFRETPLDIEVECEKGVTGVDEEMVVRLTYSNGRAARLRSSLKQTLDQTASILGEAGTITVPKFWQCKKYRVNDTWKSAPMIGKGYAHEAIEVWQCIRNGETESAQMSLTDSLAVARTLDEILDRAGINYTQLNGNL